MTAFAGLGAIAIVAFAFLPFMGFAVSFAFFIAIAVGFGAIFGQGERRSQGQGKSGNGEEFHEWIPFILLIIGGWAPIVNAGTRQRYALLHQMLRNIVDNL